MGAPAIPHPWGQPGVVPRWSEKGRFRVSGAVDPPLQLHPGTVTDDVTPVDRPAHRGSTMEA